MALLWNLTFPICIMVCIAFWTLINPIWDMKMRLGYAARLHCFWHGFVRR